MPLFWLSLAFISGVYLASTVSLPTTTWLIISVCGLAITSGIGILIFAKKMSRAPILILAGMSIALALGGARYQSLIPAPEDRSFIRSFNDWDTQPLVSGMIVTDPDRRDAFTNIIIDVHSVDLESGVDPFLVHGKLLARVSSDLDLAYGDEVYLRGKIETPPENEDFSYKAYLARNDVYSYMPQSEMTVLPENNGNIFWRGLYAFKDLALEKIFALFPDPEASLFAGILLGDDNYMIGDIQAAFKETGTAHIVAISGFNIAIIASVFTLIFARLLGPWRGSLAAIIGIFLYTLLVGADASVVRAAIMGTFVIIARLIGRKNTAANTLAIVAAIMLAHNPMSLWDAGFQLSFAATLGLILYADLLKQKFTTLIEKFVSADRAKWIAGPVSDYVLMTLAAQITTLPLLAYLFHRISISAFLINPVILPAQPPIMIVGGLAMLVSMIAFPLGQLIAWAAYPFALYTIRMVEWAATWKGGSIAIGNIDAWFVVLYYGLLLGVPFLIARYPALKERVTPALASVVIAIAALITWRSVFAMPDGNLQITFLDVGSGDAILIETPSGERILINGGASGVALSDALGRRLPPLDRSLDWLVVGSTLENQTGALPRAIDLFPPDQVLWAGNVEASRPAREVDRRLKAELIPIISAEKGQRLALGSGAMIEIAAVDSRGMTLLVVWKNFRAVLPIGINFESVDQLREGKAIGAVSVLLLADSGYGAINTREWIANLSPQVIILSVAAGDKTGLPSDATLEAVNGYSLLRTDVNGWISVETNGDKLWIEAEKSP